MRCRRWREAGVPLATLAVAWVLANPLISAPLLGASRPDQLADTLAAAEYVLDAGLKQRLDELTQVYRWGIRRASRRDGA